MLPNHKFCQVNFDKLLEMLMMHYSPSVSLSRWRHCTASLCSKERREKEHSIMKRLSQAKLY